MKPEMEKAIRNSSYEGELWMKFRRTLLDEIDRLRIRNGRLRETLDVCAVDESLSAKELRGILAVALLNDEERSQEA